MRNIAIAIVISIIFIAGCGNMNLEPNQNNQSPKIVIENDAFKIFKPAPNDKVKNEIIVEGLARVWEANVLYEFENDNLILDEGFVTASEGAPGWGNFEILISLDNAVSGNARVIIYEESAKDGSRLNELIIPVIVEN